MQAKTQTPITNSKFNLWAFWTISILSLVMTNMPLFGLVLAPITQFTTMIHELSHAIVCILTGGQVSGLTIVSDGQGHGGITHCLGGNPFLYTQAGYLGTAFFGAFLIFLCQFRGIAKPALGTLGVMFGLATVGLVGANVMSTGWQGFFSFLWGMVMSGFLVWAGIKWSPSIANLLILFLAVQTALSSVTSLIYLISAAWMPGGWSDATNMAQMTGIPALVWAVFWAAVSVGLVGFTVWITYGFKTKKA